MKSTTETPDLPAEAAYSCASADDRRDTLRQVTVLQIAKIGTDRHEELCLLRDISSTGLRAEVYHAIDLADRVSVEFRSGQIVSGQVVRVDGRLIGVRFDAVIPLADLLATEEPGEPARKARPPRLRTDAPALVAVGDQTIAARAIDVSQAGAKISVDRVLRLGARCELELDLMARRKAWVRWYRHGEAGIQFAQPMSYPEFVAWRQSLAGSGGETGTVA